MTQICARLVRQVVLVGALGGCSHAKQSVSLYEAGDFAGATRAADDQLASHPDEEDLWEMKIRAGLAQGDAATVATAYAKYVERRGDDDRELLRDVAAATLGQALESPSAKIKMIAIDAVAQAEIHSLADRIEKLFEDKDDRVVATAAIAVLRGFPEAPQFAAEMEKSENPEARRIALDGVGRKVGRLAIADFEKALEDQDARVRRVALRWLGQLTDAAAIELITKHLEDKDDGVRAAAVTALGHLPGVDRAAIAKTALADKSLSVRLAAIDLASDADLVALAGDADPMIAIPAAARAKRPDLAGPAVDRAVASADWQVRAGAVNQLVGAVGRVHAMEIAHTLLADNDPHVRLAAARVLGHAGDRQDAVDTFATMLPDLQAATDLAQLGDRRGLQALDAQLRDPKTSPDERASVAEAHRSARHITPGLVAALADPSGLVRAQAASAIVELAH
jgi:HEAT repeat protein